MSKKRKVVADRMRFNEKWESKYMFMHSRDMQKSSLYQGSGKNLHYTLILNMEPSMHINLSVKKSWKKSKV